MAAYAFVHPVDEEPLHDCIPCRIRYFETLARAWSGIPRKRGDSRV